MLAPVSGGDQNRIGQRLQHRRQAGERVGRQHQIGGVQDAEDLGEQSVQVVIEAGQVLGCRAERVERGGQNVAEQLAVAGVGEGVDGDGRGLQHEAEQIQVHRRNGQAEELIGVERDRRHRRGRDVGDLFVEASEQVREPTVEEVDVELVGERRVEEVGQFRDHVAEHQAHRRNGR